MDKPKLRTGSGAYRRQLQIEDCLYENMLHTPYASIRVADLCRQVGISRKAFYNYYHDKDACLCAYVGRVIRDAMIYTTTISSSDSVLESTTTLLKYWKSQKTFWDVIVQNQLLHFVMMESMRYIQNEDRVLLELLSTANVKTDVDILCCYMSLQITLVLQWYFRNFEPSAEEMAKKLLRLICEPILPMPPEEKTQPVSYP